MPAAESDTILIGESYQVVGMNRAQLKAHNSRSIPNWTEQAHFREFSQSLCRRRSKEMIRLFDLAATDGFQVLERFGQANRPCDVWGSGFKSMRGQFPLRFVPVHANNHLTPRLVRFHGIEQLLAPVQNSNAGRSTALMAGKDQEIAPDIFYVQNSVTGALGRID